MIKRCRQWACLRPSTDLNWLSASNRFRGHGIRVLKLAVLSRRRAPAFFIHVEDPTAASGTAVFDSIQIS